MRICVICPSGHPVELDESRLGSIVACPRCFATFHAEADRFDAVYARAEKGRARPSRDDDDDDEDDDEDEEDERPAKKKAKPKPFSKKRVEEDDDDDEDDDETSGPLTKKQQNLQMVHLGLVLIMWAIICLAVLPLLSFSMGVLMALGAGDIPWIGYIIYGFMGASELGVDVLILIGVTLGFWAPRNAELKSTIIGVMLFGCLMVFFILIGILGMTGTLIEDVAVGLRFGQLFFGLAGLSKFVFFLTTMVYLKKVAGYFKDMLLASEPINILIEFTVWYVVPQVIRLAIIRWVDVANLDAFTYIIVGLFGLFLIFATIRSYFLLFRWVNCVARIADLVAKTIKEM